MVTLFVFKNVVAVAYCKNTTKLMAGMRLGYGIAPVHLAAKIQKVKRAFHVSTMGLAAGIAALGDAAHLQKTVDNNHSERARLLTELPKLGLEVAPSQANFVMFKCPDGQDAASLTRALVAEGVMLRPAFNLPHHMRATIGTPDDNTHLLAALANILKA